MGVIIEGCPAQVPFDHRLLSYNLKRRRPGSEGVSARQETDEFECLSGIKDNVTLGTPLGFTVKNRDARPEDYKELENSFRRGHADDLWKKKFGLHDHRGGGRASGRETVARVLGGSVAQMFVRSQSPDTQVFSFIHQVHEHQLETSELNNIFEAKDPSLFIKGFAKGFPTTRIDIVSKLKQAQSAGESYGGIITVCISSPPAGLGQPVFRKFKADLAAAMLGVGSTCGFALGSLEEIFQSGQAFHSSSSSVYAGVRGGLTTGEDILFQVFFKPPSSIGRIAQKGRHDPCILPRALVVLESMTYLVLADHLLWQRLDKN